MRRNSPKQSENSLLGVAADALALALLVAGFYAVWMALPEEAMAREFRSDLPQIALMFSAPFIATVVCLVAVFVYLEILPRCAKAARAAHSVMFSFRSHATDRQFGLLLFCIGAVGGLAAIVWRAIDGGAL